MVQWNAKLARWRRIVRGTTGRVPKCTKTTGVTMTNVPQGRGPPGPAASEGQDPESDDPHDQSKSVGTSIHETIQVLTMYKDNG